MRFVLVPATLLMVLSTLVYAVAQYLNSTSGHNGTQEPTGRPRQEFGVRQQSPQCSGCADGWPDSPAKFSQRNEVIDNTPIMAVGLGLSADQLRKILNTIRAIKEAPVVLVKFVPLADKVLLVYASNRIVVSELKL